MSIAAALAIAKRELAGRTVAIPVHDGIRAETARIRRLPLYVEPTYNGGDPTHLRRLANLLEELELLCGLVATTAYWGAPDTNRWWMPTIDPFCHRPNTSGETLLLELARLPATALLWSAGIAAVAAERTDLIFRLVTSPLVPHPYRLEEPAVAAALLLTPDKTLGVNQASRALYRDLLRPIFVDHLGLGPDIALNAFERWQYLVAVVGWDLRLVTNRFVAQFRPHLRVDDLSTVVPVASGVLHDELSATGIQHPLLVAGLFGGKQERAIAAMERFDEDYSTHVAHLDKALRAGNNTGVLPSGRRYPGSFEDHDESG